jgi:3-keto-5-aminohexanoate cleavage enzyme
LQDIILTPTIITCAITGSVPKKAHNPSLPITPTEQIESTQEAFEAGASLVHIHVREEDESPSSDPVKFALVQEGVKKFCPGIIIQFSTGGRGRDPAQRASALHLRPDMASLTTGTVNFPNIIYTNPPEFIRDLASRMLEINIKPEIEVFDLSMLYVALEMAEQELLKTPLHVQFVMGIKNALPARREALVFMVEELGRLAPDATWVAAGIGRNQRVVNKWCAELGGHMRTGLEDNVRYDKKHLAKNNAQLVALAAEICAEHGTRPATAVEARGILGL